MLWGLEVNNYFKSFFNFNHTVMPNLFIGVKITFGTVKTYFDTATGNPVGDFDHFSFVPVIPAITASNNNYSLLVFAIDKNGIVLNSNEAIPSTDDTSSGHTHPANKHVNFSIINLYYEQLKVLYPTTATAQSELRVYPHNFSGVTEFMTYKAETEDKKRERLISGDLNPSPPKNSSRIF